jgi:WD40 repeat protein
MLGTIWRTPSKRLIASLLLGFAAGWAIFLAPLERPRAELPALPERASTPLIQISPDSRLLAIAQLQGNPERFIKGIGYNSCNLRLWNLADGSLEATLAENDDSFVGISFAPDSKSLAARLWTGKVRIWNCSTGEVTEEWDTEKAGFFGNIQLLYTPDGRLLTQDVHEPTKLRNVRTGKIAFDCGEKVKPYEKVLTHLPGVVVAQREHETLVIRMDQEELTGKFTAEAFSVFSVSRDCQSMLGIGHGKHCVWSVDDGVVDSVPFRGEVVSSFNFLSADGRYFVVFEHKAEKKWWFFGENTRRISVHGTLYAVRGAQLFSFPKASMGVFSPDGKSLVLSRDYDGIVQIWDFPLPKPWHWILAGGVGTSAFVYGLLRWIENRIAKRRARSA